MREIKFNCWNKHWNEMYSWEIMCDDGLNNYMTKDDIWLQYTGLKDKRGHELYEGDIINDEYCNMEIFWLEDEAMFVAGWPDEWFYLRDQAECSTYVGNKYEHPELLEVTE